MMGRPYEGPVPGQYRPNGAFGAASGHGSAQDLHGGYQMDRWEDPGAPPSPKVAAARQLRAEQDAAFQASLQVQSVLVLLVQSRIGGCLCCA